jgi:hypothetical protein
MSDHDLYSDCPRRGLRDYVGSNERSCFVWLDNRKSIRGGNLGCPVADIRITLANREPPDVPSMGATL